MFGIWRRPACTELVECELVEGNLPIWNLNHMNFSSTLLDQAVQEFYRLPGIGKKQRLGWYCIY